MKYLKRLPLPFPAALSALFLLLTCNQTLWRTLFRIKGGDFIDNLLFYLPFSLVLLLVLVLFFSLFRFNYLFKPVLVFFFLAAASVDYFMRTYGVVIDKSMLQNALETNPREAAELLNKSLFLHIFLLGGLPSLLLMQSPVHYQSFGKQVLHNMATVLLCAVGIIGLCYFFYGDYVSIYRNNRHLRHLINPVNLVDSSIANLKRKLKRSHALVGVGADAKVVKSPSAKKSLIILVLGETARAANFQLNGYARPTNPYLSHEAVFSFTNVHSCGTATAASVPCMFSVFGQANYDPAKAEYTENVLDVLSHAAVQVLWRNNNSGCKDVCNRVPHEDLSTLKLAETCRADECYDEILLYRLQEYVNQLSRHGVIVLHQQGSHGPAYHLRHPAKFTVFKPECQKALLNDCSQQEVVNAYDNTLVYTDYVLSKVIDFLKKNAERYDTAMVYVSDHGESLGENNVYLHGLPYFVAPDVQKHVPLIAWFSPEFIASHQLNAACLRQQKNAAFSHDNLFHSLLGLMDVKTEAYQPALDMFAACRT